MYILMTVTVVIIITINRRFDTDGLLMINAVLVVGCQNIYRLSIDDCI